MYGTSKELTARMVIYDHAFRFQPNNSSLCVENVEEKINFIKMQLNSLIAKQKDFSKFECSGYTESPDYIKELLKISLQQLHQEVTNQGKDSLGNVIEKFLLLFKTNYKKEYGCDCPKDFLDKILLQILVDQLGSSRANNCFPCFGDTNWKHDDRPIHYTLFFNPLSDIWTVASTIQDPKRDQPICIIGIEHDFFAHLRILDEIAPIANEVKRKELLDMDRVVSKRLFQLEKTFSICWKELLTTELNEANLHEIVRESSEQQEKTRFLRFEEKEIPELLLLAKKLATEDTLSWTSSEIFRQCCIIRSLYQTMLKKHLQPSVGEEYRFSVFLEKEEFSKYITNDDAFFQAVHSLLKLEK